MPIYEFSCPSCGHEVEDLFPINTESIECPACGEEMRKGISVSSFHLKGHFWYGKDRYGLKDTKKKKKEPKKK